MTAERPGIPDSPIDTPPRGFVPDDEQLAILHDTLHAAGVELGDYDERIAAWLAMWEWSTVAVIASWIKRAHNNRDEEN